MMHIDFRSLERDANALRTSFQQATPFQHLALDGLLTLPAEAMEMFPGPEWEHWNELGDRYQVRKLACGNIQVIPEPFASVIHEACSPRFLRALEVLTGIEKLIPDPYLSGGGLHMSGPGGTLSMHTDFHIYRRLDLYRRINVIFYLNDQWGPDDGGFLTLATENGEQIRIPPIMGRMVIFATDDRSIHGFPDPVSEGRWRRSIALYYYTAHDAAAFSGDETTYWRDHGAASGLVRKARLALYKSLLNLSRGVSIAAHIVNPNQGLGLVRTVLKNKAKSQV